jgi:hypothetical protein
MNVNGSIKTNKKEILKKLDVSLNSVEKSCLTEKDILILSK